MKSHDRWNRMWPPVSVLVVVLVIWQVWVDIHDVSKLVLPSPWAIAENIVRNWRAYLGDGWVTLGEAAIGFAVALVLSLSAASVMTLSRTAYSAINPLQTALRSMPIVAIAPALVLWLGFGAAPKVVIAAAITFPPLLVNALTGLGRVDPDALEVLQSVGASKREVFFALRVPHSLPYVLAAAKVCVSLALVGAVVGEWAGATSGLGHAIVRAQSDLETTTVWGATVVLGLYGIVLTRLVTAVERRVLRHHPAPSDHRNQQT